MLAPSYSFADNYTPFCAYQQADKHFWHHSNMANVSFNIRRRIETEVVSKGVSLHQIAKASGVAYSVLWNAVNNDDAAPTRRTLEKIARYFRCTVDDLYSDSDRSDYAAKEQQLLEAFRKLRNSPRDQDELIYLACSKADFVLMQQEGVTILESKTKPTSKDNS